MNGWQSPKKTDPDFYSSRMTKKLMKEGLDTYDKGINHYGQNGDHEKRKKLETGKNQLIAAIKRCLGITALFSDLETTLTKFESYGKKQQNALNEARKNKNWSKAELIDKMLEREINNIWTHNPRTIDFLVSEVITPSIPVGVAIPTAKRKSQEE